MTHYKTFPFTAIIGQETMKLALILNAINPKIGGVLIKGTKGTAKSTAVRALADLLPDLEVIKDCPFNCNPHNLKEACHSCQHRIEDKSVSSQDIELRKMRVINLPINATEDRVIGTIDLKKALNQGQKVLEPGILAEANRNILYIDEVNLLADNVADILLDSAAMGINIVEREGISIHHPANFILIGTMNPEEGNIRPQLLDRFGLGIDVENISALKDRVEIIKRAEAYHRNPSEFYNQYIEKQTQLRDQIIQAQQRLVNVEISEELLMKIAEICIEYHVDGHRSDIAINVTAKTLAAFEGKTDVTLDHIKTATKMVLNHRLRRLPFEDPHFDEKKLEKICNNDPQTKPKERMDNSKKDLQKQNSGENNSADIKSSEEYKSDIVNPRQQTFQIASDLETSQILQDKKSKINENASGRVIAHPTTDKRGIYTGDNRKTSLNLPLSKDIAIVPTLNDAVLEPDNQNFHQHNHGSEIHIQIKERNLHIKQRTGKSSYLLVFCVDASGSMGVNNRMEAVKGTVFSLLQSSYIRRDKVAMVIFRQETAAIVLPPTRSMDLAYKLLREIPTGGTTPLPAGLLKAWDVIKEERRKDTGYIPVLIVITDARTNVSFKDNLQDILNIGQAIVKDGVESIVIDTEQAEIKLDLAKNLAESMHAAYYHVDQFKKTELDQILRTEGFLENQDNFKPE